MSKSNFIIEIAIRSQKILNNMLFNFYKQLTNNNNYFMLNENNIIIIKSGNYIININCEFDQDVIIELNVNNINTHQIESDNNLIIFHDIIKFDNYDNINIKNLSNCDINIKNNNHIKLIKI
jgi:hypothetical protein